MISYTFFLKCLKLYFYSKIRNPSKISFYVWCEVVHKLCFFLLQMTNCPIIVYGTVHYVYTDWQCHFCHI